ncbi:unnamed protein product [Urochloa humidicola]
MANTLATRLGTELSGPAGILKPWTPGSCRWSLEGLAAVDAQQADALGSPVCRSADAPPPYLHAPRARGRRCAVAACGWPAVRTSAATAACGLKPRALDRERE